MSITLFCYPEIQYLHPQHVIFLPLQYTFYIQYTNIQPVFTESLHQPVSNYPSIFNIVTSYHPICFRWVKFNQAIQTKMDSVMFVSSVLSHHIK